jgi:hypothetical protein
VPNAADTARERQSLLFTGFEKTQLDALSGLRKQREVRSVAIVRRT